MITLTVATSGDPCSIGVSDDRGPIAERTYRHRMHLSERLVGDVDGVLRDAGVELAGLDAFVVDIGPGSFTGVRVGVTAIKTWADMLGKPVVGVSALEALAWPFVGLHAGLIVAMIRARPGAAYVCQFDGQTGDQIDAAVIASAAEIAQMASEWGGKRVTICGEGWAPFEADIRSATKAGGERAEAALVPPAEVRAGVFDLAGRQRLRRRGADSAIDLVPLYIAPPPINTKAK